MTHERKGESPACTNALRTEPASGTTSTLFRTWKAKAFGSATRPRPAATRAARRQLGRLVLLTTVLIAPGTPADGSGRSSGFLALFPPAAHPNWQGFARIVNHSGTSGTAYITGIDDGGIEHGPVEISLEAHASVHFNSTDLEEGNPDKGLSGGLGDGQGDWRLHFESDLDLELLSYVRTGDGFVTAMHELVPLEGMRHHIRLFNPGSNRGQVSRLRLINPTVDAVEVTIEGRDDEGNPAPGGTVRLTLDSGAARTLTAQALESGADELVGHLGDGKGKWQLFVSANGSVHVMSLLQSPTGHLANLSGGGIRLENGLSGADRSIVRYLTEPIEEGRSPGLLAAIVDIDGVRAVAAAGVRREGSPEEFTVHDLVHIGSNTKAMTATMLATLVADGSFPRGWQTTVAEAFSELVGEIHTGYHAVTLRQLVTMAGGIARNARSWWIQGGPDIVATRYQILRENLTYPPAGPSGEYLYSNLSYMIAGAMAERVTGKSWETLMEERLFAPLGMSEAGFGPPGRPNRIEQPWGHSRDGSEAWIPNQHDNAPALGPAGTVHLSVADWAEFIALWFNGTDPKILDRSRLNALATPDAGNYAAGWYVGDAGWAGGVALGHGGSNTNWRTLLRIAPDRGVAYLAVANAYEEDTLGHLDFIVSRLITHVP